MKLEKTILKKLVPYKNKERAKHDRGYMNTKLDLLGCNMPSVRQVAARVFDDLSLSHQEMRLVMNKLWQTSKTFDILHIPLIYFQNRKETNDLADWKIIKNWSNKIDNWAHSDYLSDSIAALLERYPAKIYPELKKWNESSNPWQRRLSLTSLIYYAPQRKKPLPVTKVLPLVKARLGDTDPFVQKAVGWTLRECHNIYPVATKDFVKKNICSLSSTAFSYATEKWGTIDKELLKTIRKNYRKKYA
ncbi:MAG: DNA alkylation repair protein [Patescibacteria group bacterium]